MLKLKKLQILGFKSFCDRTEVVLPGFGIAAIVGPNGCGKSNISDAISWVLGEQSARNMRGVKMEDVIFAGTQSRKSTGMAEVSLTLVDPDVYDGSLLAEDRSQDAGPEIVIENELPEGGDWSGDWDEDALRAQKAEETEEATLDAQPGQILPSDQQEGAAAAEVQENLPAPVGVLEASQAGSPNNVVLKIRRRKFGRQPVRAGEIVVARRLFRSGESEYLLNGKICRLRDIQDIFMGTGLGPESYAIIEQQRIGQLLSSKPHDRRAIIEEAAGITRFKTKKRLAELRLESAKLNLARVNDIFEEVARQMNSLKRQAAKAERYGALRDELRKKLRVVLASHMAQMDAEQTAAAAQIADLGAQIDEQAASTEALDAMHTEGVARGYALDTSAREANQRANQATVELERSTARLASNEDRIADLATRLASGAAELEQVKAQLEGLAGERDQQKLFLENAAAETTAARELAQQKQRQAQEAGAAVSVAERSVESHRQQSMQLISRTSGARNQVAQAEESLAGLQREAERLANESDAARRELETLGAERGQVSLQFGSVTERLKALEVEISTLRLDLQSRRNEEAEAKRNGDKLRAETAMLQGRRNSLDNLLKEHSYSTDTVRNLFRSNSLGGGLKPAGVLADFLEVDAQYENVVEEFLRDELNFIVVKSWDAAEEGVRLLKADVDGRATFLVHPDDSQALFSFAKQAEVVHGEQPAGVIALKDCIRVLDGFGSALEVILPKLREGYVTPDAMTARSLALQNPNAFFLAPTGECFHNVTVTGGRPRAEGPLALKRELRETQQKLDKAQAALAQTEVQVAALARNITEMNATLESRSEARREAEREAANSGAALRQMESEAGRLERRLQEWTLQTERNRAARGQREELIAQKRQEAAQLEADREGVEAKLVESQAAIEGLRQQREAAQQAAAAASAQLAAIEERRRNAQANYEQTARILNGQQQRASQIAQQLAAAAGEKQQREAECVQLAERQTQWKTEKEQALAEAQRHSSEAAALREQMTALDQQLRTVRHEVEQLREQRSTLSSHAAKLASDLEHLEATCLNDLGVEAHLLRADESIARIEAESLASEEESSRALKQKLEAMGPVNMMALDEYNEVSARHLFLETQKKDLLDSIENTQQTIKEIDEISTAKFEEAFARINENFSVTFTKLFGGGQGFMRLTDLENTAESGIDIVASPPGKKLQNVLLLSGGEKALTALSLLVGIFQYQPSPFCVLDEVDAPLDETNVGRFAKLIAEMSVSTQFIVITHSKRTMSEADMIYGVTMQEPGVSKIVSVKLAGKHEPQRQLA
ncbi:MAG: chromosome segregation protein SMC [Acidobacteriaceae bacterium]